MSDELKAALAAALAERDEARNERDRFRMKAEAACSCPEKARADAAEAREKALREALAGAAELFDAIRGNVTDEVAARGGETIWLTTIGCHAKAGGADIRAALAKPAAPQAAGPSAESPAREEVVPSEPEIQKHGLAATQGAAEQPAAAPAASGVEALKAENTRLQELQRALMDSIRYVSCPVCGANHVRVENGVVRGHPPQDRRHVGAKGQCTASRGLLVDALATSDNPDLRQPPAAKPEGGG